jgi:hypothetical protein
VGLTIEPSDCTDDPGGTDLNRLVEIAPSVVVVPAASAEIIVPDAVICDPTSVLLTVLAGATITPVGLIIEPFAITIEPAGTKGNRLAEIFPSVVVVPAVTPLMIVPEAVTWDPTTGSGTVPGGATITPVGLIIEPSPRTDDPGGTDVSKLLSMAPSVVVVPAANPEIIVPDAVICDPSSPNGSVPLGATITPVGLIIEPSDCTDEPAGTEVNKLVEILPSVVVVPAATAEITVPEAVTWDPTTGLGTDPAGATTTPVGLIMEPSPRTDDPGGTDVSKFCEMVPSVVVGATALAGMIFPEAVTCDPSTGSATVPAGATTTPVGLTIEPSSCTVEPGGIDLNMLVEIVAKGTTGGTALAGIIDPDAVTTEPSATFGTDPGGATITPVTLTTAPSRRTTEPGGIEAKMLVETVPRLTGGGAALAGRIDPAALITDPSTAFGTVPAGATIAPDGPTTEPSACTLEPAGIDAKAAVGIVPKLTVGGSKFAGMIVPDEVIAEPSTAFGIDPGGATTEPDGLITEPFD